MLPYLFDLPPQTADEGSQQLKSQRPPWRIRDQVSARVEVCETRQQNLASCLCVFACETMDLPNHRARSLQRLDCLMGFARATEHNPYGPSGWRVGPLGTLLASGVGLRRLILKDALLRLGRSMPKRRLWRSTSKLSSPPKAPSAHCLSPA